ncbi:hypothetical protein NIES23_04590 [Trichormus variabilis NIES-23]|uniref:Uncharacterized protein n=1 Tax=Trichormus variabilis NIES-23 TaxID=1973479 RepID=A0A1Z4KFB8_ANAVA|nr:hypothetical protein NIES23_04590 [Trichormus variabilis NIES-23]
MWMVAALTAIILEMEIGDWEEERKEYCFLPSSNNNYLRIFVKGAIAYRLFWTTINVAQMLPHFVNCGI